MRSARELITVSDVDPPLTDKAQTNSAHKAAATVRRNKEERRAESLRQIRAQTADGTLVVRQMTVAQHEAASEAARRTLAENEARRKRYRAPSGPDS